MSVLEIRRDEVGETLVIQTYHRSADLLEELEQDAALVHHLRRELDLLDAELADPRMASFGR